jgi:beta-galactosidase
MTFQWSDGWWKVGQEDRLDVQDTDAGWSNEAYLDDWSPGDNNMNEEWWGVMAKGPTDATGHFQLYPRAAYYALQRRTSCRPTARHRHSPRFAHTSVHRAGRDGAAGVATGRACAESGEVRISGMRLELSTFSTGGSISTPEGADASPTARPAFRGFDHLESYFVDVTARPASNVTAMVSLNVTRQRPRTTRSTNSSTRIGLARARCSRTADRR